MSLTVITMNSNQLLSNTMNVLVLDIPKSTKAKCSILFFNGSTVKAHWLSLLIMMTPCCYIKPILPRLVLVKIEDSPYFTMPNGCPTLKLVWEVNFNVHCC